jgi:hypothetical protein
MKKMLLAGAAVLALSACGQRSEEAGGLAKTEVMNSAEAVDASAVADAASEGMTAPRIDQSVAPGVAFDFNYAFSLPEARISAAQEEHASLCGRLGISRCRVTGMTFNKERNGEVDARLSFKIDPALALSFGRDAAELVEKLEGKLESSTVTGEDVGTSIIAGDKSAEALRAELRQIEAQLKIPNLSKQVRGQLVERQNQINSELRNLKVQRDDQVESLATTPMAFTYEPSEAVLGFDRGTAVQQGLSVGASSFGAMLSVIAFALGAAGPWVLLAGAGYWLIRRFRKRDKSVTAE